MQQHTGQLTLQMQTTGETNALFILKRNYRVKYGKMMKRKQLKYKV